MMFEEERAIVERVRRQSSNKDILAVCEFVERLLGDPIRVSEAEKRRKNYERVKRWRAKQRAAANPFE